MLDFVISPLIYCYPKAYLWRIYSLSVLFFPLYSNTQPAFNVYYLQPFKAYKKRRALLHIAFCSLNKRQGVQIYEIDAFLVHIGIFIFHNTLLYVLSETFLDQCNQETNRFLLHRLYVFRTFQKVVPFCSKLLKKFFSFSAAHLFPFSSIMQMFCCFIIRYMHTCFVVTLD